ncbi:solute carrier organic anion transporter family member 4A1-like [Acropora millepora]|uniref:solute carrier organic anion transporter family member 4A1-like n=1 Tax=Acropora millepora TaxID=45264 RepID=UPI001CF4B081|nr:solute carrier organic anion transporter family member 4A1-like [Acropora millepora]
MGDDKTDTKEAVNEETPLHIEVKEPDEDLRYGWGKFRPALLQVLNNPKFFTVTVSFFSFIQGMSVNGFTNIFLLTLERRFHLTSTEVGFIAASNDIAGIVLTSLVSFYGTYGNKIKWLGYGSVVTGLGCLLFVLPQVLVGRYEPILDSNGFANGEICRMGGNATSEFCFGQYGGEWYYIFIFFLGQLLMGAGTTPLYTLGPAYIDENVHPKSSPVYLAVFFSLTLLGPGLGFIGGGSLLNIYIDITRPEGSNLAPNDPQWIGAWWLGYVAGGSILVIISGLLLGFPRELPGAKRIREEAQKEGVLPKKDEKIKGSVKDILPATLQLLKTPVFIFNTLAVSSGSLFGAGIASFLAKILQLKFGISPFITGVVIGTILVPGTVGGVLLGGFLVRRFDLKKSLKMAARFCVIASFFTLAGSGAWFVPGCGVPDLVGVTVPHKGSSALQGSKVTLSCNVNCSCSQASINPVCGEDNLSYLSPCHAGCRNFTSEQTFANCGCISSQGNSSTRSAVKGYCTKRSGCKTYLAFILLLVVVLFSVFITAIANKTVVLRCVAYNQRAYALGVQFILQRSIGFLPGPLMFGAIFDSTCMLWGQSCGRRGNCLFNDMEVLTDRLGYTAIGFTGIAFLFYFLSFWFCKDTIQEEERSKHKQSFKDEEEGLKENDEEEKHVESVM